MQVSPKTIYQWTHIGFIPHYRFPKGLRFREAEIEKWVAYRKIKGRSAYPIAV